MLVSVMDWFTNNWLEVVSLAIALVALIYASMAHYSSKEAARATKTSDVTHLRLQAKSSLSKADRSFLSLQSACNVNRDLWKRHDQKYFPLLSVRSFDQSDELKSIGSTERDGARLLHCIRESYAGLNEMHVEQLEVIIQETDQTGIQIERLAHRLQEPPQLFH